ncbi:hypothetical protein [Chryseobacterium sp. S90]|uniref:hypothetical protein n=1 Tax=Chryseobacterium sp. S90 TaxID=3395373 RepID=UPI0039BC4C12
MKNLFVIIILIFSFKCYSQSYYKNLFDSKGYDTSIGYSNNSNQLEFSWGVSANMEALVLMYEKTKEKKYAETLIKCIGNVIDRRDDLRIQVQGLSRISDYRKISGAAWSTNHYNVTTDKGDPYSHLVHSANIVYPMAKFAAIIKLNNSILRLISDPGGRYGNQTYSHIADDIIQKVQETLNYHKDQWHSESKNIGYYKEWGNNNSPISHPGVILPFNMQSAVGRVLIQMYRATFQRSYLTQVYQIANFIKSNTSYNNELESNNWKYWKYNDLAEDVSHAALTISFPYECYKYKLLYNKKSIYSYLEIKRYINTFTNDIATSSLLMNGGVNDHAQYWDLKSNTKVGSLTYDSYICNRWLYLGEYDKKLYSLIVDIQKNKNYNTKLSVDDSLTLALLAYNEN